MRLVCGHWDYRHPSILCISPKLMTLLPVSLGPSFGLTKIIMILIAWLAVAEKLKREGRQEITAMDKAEEFEDEEGNVYDKRTYEQLQRQGLI